MATSLAFGRRRSIGRMGRAAPAYLSLPPSPAAARFLESLWVQDHPESRADWPATTVVPAGRLEVVACYGDPFEHIDECGVSSVPRVALMGQRTRAIRVRATGRTGLVLASLHPWAARALFGDDAPALRDSFVEAAAVLGDANARSLAEAVAASAAPALRARALEAALLRILRPDGIDLSVAQAVAWINGAYGAIPVQTLASGLGLSRRQLSRRFQAASGLPPKDLATIVRFQKALGLLHSGASAADVAARCGLYDQSHLIRLIRERADRSPRRLPARRTDTLGRTFNRSDLSAYYNAVYL